MIHNDDKVEVVEVLPAYLSRPAVEVVSMGGTMPAHSRVGQFAHMPRPYSGRVDKEVIFPTLFLHYMLHYSLGSRRAAYITKAHKKNLFLHTSYNFRANLRIISQTTKHFIDYPPNNPHLLKWHKNIVCFIHIRILFINFALYYVKPIIQ